MIEFNQEQYKELCELIKYDNSILFLGQEYQSAFGGENFFVEEINHRLCKKGAENSSYANLWAKMSENSTSSKKEGGKTVLDELQKNRLMEIGSEIPQNPRLTDALNIGWASIVTSAIDPGIVNAEGVNCNPIYNVNTRPAGIANKRKLHVTYMFGCVIEEGSYPISYKIRGVARSDAEKMYSRVVEEAIPYSGALVIDGWNPVSDWASVDMILGNSNLDADLPYPKIFIFSCTTETKEKIRSSERSEELVNSNKLVVSEKSLYECLERYISAIRQEKQDEQEAMQNLEIISFQRGKKNISISIPREQLRELDSERIHLLTPRDRMQVAFDQDGLRNVTINFLANGNSSFPYWQGYLQGCYFDRDVYENSQKSGLYDKVLAVLQSPNLHKVDNTILLHGPSNSGKSVLLGKLALDLSQSYPVLFIKGELEADDPELTRYRYDSLVNFINTYLTRNIQTSGKIRAVVVWDNNAFIDRIQNYLELAKELAESNTVLVGSAYELRDMESDPRKPKKGVYYLYVSPTLNSKTELKNLEKMLSTNLGQEFMDAFNHVRSSITRVNSRPDLIHDENRILSLLQRTFRVPSDEYAQIIDEAVSRTDREAASAEVLMRNRFENAIKKASKSYNIDISGLAEILASCTEETQKDEDWYQQLAICAPTLNDILALSGQFGIRLPLNLVKKVICDPDICPDIKYYMDAVDDILAFDTMLEYPFSVDESGHVMVGYRSPDEAEIYLNSHFTSRGCLGMDIPYDNEGNIFLEDREIYLLEKLIEYSNLGDYSRANWHTVTTVRELIDQFGSNSRKGKEFSNNYKRYYDRLATFILEHGGSENPEMALSAASLKREQIIDSMLSKINYNFNISHNERIILDDAAEGLEHAMEIEERENNENTPRMMRIYVEWCTNRNYILDRENPTTHDLELFRQIHRRFSKALSIYQKQDIHRMKPMSMMDVYLNGFSYYVDSMEKLYHVDSQADKADPVKMIEYTDEISYAITSVLGKLLDFDDIVDYKSNLNKNILKVYRLSRKSVSDLATRTRAHGSAAYILLYARNLWIKQDVDNNHNDIQDVSQMDLYLTSDCADRPGTLSSEVITAANKVYQFLTQSNNLNVLLSKKIGGEKEVGALEMLIRATWIVKTGNMPFTLNQFPKLNRADWDELHKYCRAYTESGSNRAKYAFAYYLEGIYYWTFTADSYNHASGTTPSKEKFDYCTRSSIRPRGVYPTDSYIYLCELNTGNPIKLNARVTKQSAYRDVADITSALDPRMINDIPYVKNRRRIFCAQSLQRLSQKNGVQSKVITIRFNLQGALAGPENPEMEVSSYGKE